MLVNPVIPNEDFLHWIWENLHYNTEDLVTSDGRKIAVLDPGEHNSTDGPDFKRAQIAIDGLNLYGSVEIHNNENEWYTHNHHTQSGYNQVILHVVLNRQQKRVKNGTGVYRQDGTPVPTLELAGRLPAKIERLIHSFQSNSYLPCSSLIEHISAGAIYRQFENAHKEYFDRKVNELVSNFNPSLPPTRAWREALIIGLFDGLGISKNRIAMRQLARDVLKEARNSAPEFDFMASTLETSGLYNEPPRAFKWNRRACRPANRPKIRVRQAGYLGHMVMNTPMKSFLNQAPPDIWESWFSGQYTPGKQRRKIMYATVFLPSLYYLGTLGQSKKICNIAYEEWRDLRVPYPKSLSVWFKDAGFPNSVFEKKLGAVHQLKRYCHQGRCNECELLKSATSA